MAHLTKIYSQFGMMVIIFPLILARPKSSYKPLRLKSFQNMTAIILLIQFGEVERHCGHGIQGRRNEVADALETTRVRKMTRVIKDLKLNGESPHRRQSHTPLKIVHIQ